VTENEGIDTALNPTPEKVPILYMVSEIFPAGILWTQQGRGKWSE
jgi:hypothetical protein